MRYFGAYFGSMTVLLLSGAVWAARKEARLLIETYGAAACLVGAECLYHLVPGPFRLVVWSGLGAAAVIIGARLSSVAVRAAGALVLCIATLMVLFDHTGVAPCLLLVSALIFVKRIEARHVSSKGEDANRRGSTLSPGPSPSRAWYARPSRSLEGSPSRCPRR